VLPYNFALQHGGNPGFHLRGAARQFFCGGAVLPQIKA